MNRETAIRRELTPDVLDNVGEKLVETALQNGCGARFTGAGGGGCIWALGEIGNVDRLRPLWEEIFLTRKQAIGIITVAAVRRPPGRLNVSDLPGFRPQGF